MTEGYAGQLLIVPPHFKYAHTSRDDAKEGFVDDWMYFGSETPLEKFEELDIPLGVAFDVVDKRLLKPYIEKLSFEKETQEIGYERQITALLEEMFIKIARQRTYCGESDNRKRLMFDKLRREMLSQYSSPHTLEELAAKVGYKTKSAINKIELGIRDLPQKKIVQFAEALGTTPGALMGWVNEETGKKNDALVGVVKKMRSDPDFFDVVSMLAELPAEQIVSLKPLISALGGK
jgi:transcriptional regulator with XRE-family HTH domain